MTPQAYSVQPPRVAAWLVSLYSSAEEAESILGDLLEEFSSLALQSGDASARRWYWRQTGATIAHLFGRAVRMAPWSTTAAVVGGLFLMSFGFRLEERAIFAVLHRYRVFDYHFDAYVFFASTGIEIGRVILSLFVGCVVALAAKGRETIATTTLAFIFSAMAGTALVVWLATGQALFLWNLAWQFAGWIAIVIGGGMVRTARLRLSRAKA